MFGLRFIDGDNALICMSAKFTIEHRSGPRKMYRYVSGPHGGYLDELHGDEQKRMAHGRNCEDVLLSLLPTDRGLEKWTWRDFIIALSFWAEGRRSGETRAAWHS